MTLHGLIRTVTVTCRNPRCEATWGVRITRENEAPCTECGATHAMDEEGFYWMLDGEGES